MLSRIELAKSLSDLLPENRVATFKWIRESGYSPDLTLDTKARGNGNAYCRRMGYSNEIMPCYCDASPCAHEWIHLRAEARGEEHRARRGVKTKGFR